jgi:hypothetical protein
VDSHRISPALEPEATSARLPARRRRNLPLFGWPDLVFLAAGLALNLIAEFSVIPVLAFLLAFAVGLGILFGLRWNRPVDLKLYVRSFLVYWMCAGISGVFRTLLNDEGQLVGDAANFFLFSSTNVGGMTLEQIRNLFSEGAAAIKIWHAIYTAASWIGIKAVPSLGISLNMLATALSAVIVLRSAEHISGQNYRTYRFIEIAFSACGLLGLAASIHLRDALILPVVAGLSYAWIRYCISPFNLWRLLIAILCSAAAAPVLYYLRAELLYIPLLLTMVAVAAIFGWGKIPVPRAVRIMVVVVTALVAAYSVNAYTSVVDQTIDKGREDYSTKVEQTSSERSLGAALIVHQSPPVRAVAGTLYLFIFPVPVWAGVTFGTAYMLFKSISAVFFYFALPLVALGIKEALFGKRGSAAGAFAALSGVIVAVAIALSSLEVRHFIPFVGLLFITATIPDLSNGKTRLLYKNLTTGFIALIVLGHVAWGILKLA